MNIFRHTTLRESFLVCAIFLTACASTTMQSVRRAPDFQAARIKKVLVVCIARTPQRQELLEKEFVRQWKARGVDAVASGAILPAGITLDKVGIAPLAKAQGFDGVFLTRVLTREKIEPTIVRPKNDSVPPAPEDANLTQYVQAVVASPEYAINYEEIILSAVLYDAATEQRLWSGVSQTLITGDTVTHIRAFAKVILKTIFKRGN